MVRHNRKVKLLINSRSYELEVGRDIQPWYTLARTLRDVLGLTGTKVSCDRGACGACTVLLNGKAILACTKLTIECHLCEVTTIEGLGDHTKGKLDPIQEAFIRHNAFQCGFCTPGIIMSAKALLNKVRFPKDDEIKEALSGHFCRCISHYHVLKAVKEAAIALSQGK